MTPEGRKKLSAALKKKWASGTRKLNHPETRKKQSLAMRKAIDEGRYSPRVFTQEDRTKAALTRNSKTEHEKKLVGARISAANTGKEMPPGPSAKGPDHWKAKYWILKTPGQEIIHGWNLNELVRTHAELFDPADIVWRRSSCKAVKGLLRLFEMKKDGSGPRTLSWKGWMIGDRRDEEPNDEVSGRAA